MKNSPMAVEASWAQALRLFDADLRRRGSAERTRTAYGIDLGQFARWSVASGIAPTEVTYPVLRRYAVRLGQERATPATVARKLAAIRSFFRTQVEHGHMGANPADLLPAPKQPERLPTI